MKSPIVHLLLALTLVHSALSNRSYLRVNQDSKNRLLTGRSIDAYQEETEFAAVVDSVLQIPPSVEFPSDSIDTTTELLSEGKKIPSKVPHSVEVDPSMGFPVETETIVDIPAPEEVPGVVVDTPTELSSQGQQISAEVPHSVEVDPMFDLAVETETIATVNQNVADTADGE